MPAELAPPQQADSVLESGIALVANVSRDHAMEVGLVGPDDTRGLPIVLGTDRAQHETYMQVPTTAAQGFIDAELRSGLPLHSRYMLDVKSSDHYYVEPF